MPVAPLLMDVSSLVISAFCISYLAWIRFRFLIANDWTRYILCILIACIPNNEVFMNITNIQWFLGIYVTLWALDQWQNFETVETRQRASSTLESGMATVSNLSTAIGLLLIPILIYVALKRLRPAISKGFAVLVVIPIIGSFIQFLVFASAPRFLEGNSEDLVSAFHLSTGIMTNLVYENSAYIPAGTVLYILAIFVLTFSTITYSFVRTRIGRDVRGWLLILSGAFILAMGFFRTGIAGAGRYFFFPSALLLILIVASFQSLNRKRAQVFAIILLVIVGTNFVAHYTISPSPDFKFQSYAKFYDPSGGSFIYAPIPPWAGLQGVGGWFCPIPASPAKIASSISLTTTYRAGSVILNVALAYPGDIRLSINNSDLSVNKTNTTFVFLRGWTVGVTDSVNVFLIVDGTQAFPTSFRVSWLWGETAPQGWDNSGWIGTITLSGLSVGWHVVSFLISTQSGVSYIATTKLSLDVYM
jgi:hypothetical protein